MKFLIAGLGSVGRRHLRNLQSLGHRDIVLYRTGHSTLPDDDLATLTTEYDLAKALAHRPTVAIISNPTALHLPVTLAAALAGCHLFIEKPVSHSLEGLDELTAIAHQRGLRVMVGFQYRFHPGLRIVKQLVDDGAIGRVIHAQAHWGEYLPAWHPWEDYRQSYSARADLGGGVILTLCHTLDYLRWLLGEVGAVWAETGRLSDLNINVEDVADITLRFRSGAIGTVHLDYVQRPPSHWLQLIGQKGTIRWDSDDSTVRCYRTEKGTWAKTPLPQEFNRNSMFLDELRHFLDCIGRQAEPPVTLEDGIQALRIALAAKQSAAEGRAVDV